MLVNEYGVGGSVEPGTLAFVQIHPWGGGATTWGSNRATFYSVPGTPMNWWDGVRLDYGGSGSTSGDYDRYRTSLGIRGGVATDVTIEMTGNPVTGSTYNIIATVCVEGGGTGKTMRIYVVQVLDYWPFTPTYHRNGFKQAANTEDHYIGAGQCQVIDHDFTFDTDSWNNQSDIKIIAWAQEPLASGPADVYQAAVMTWPFPQAGDQTPPEPHPMTWDTTPEPVSTTEITMTATEATDETPPVEYYFRCELGDCTTSGWVADRVYNDTGLLANTEYAYKVRAQDGVEPPNRNAWSPTESTFTHIETPTGISFGTITDNTIEVTADGSFTNLAVGDSGIYFEMTPDEGTGANVWEQSQTITVSGLTPGTWYTFEVQARNQGQATTPWVGPVSVRTTGGSCGYDPGDVNQDGYVDGEDIQCFTECLIYSSGVGCDCDCADVAAPSGLDMDDVSAFVSLLLASVG